MQQKTDHLLDAVFKKNLHENLRIEKIQNLSLIHFRTKLTYPLFSMLLNIFLQDTLQPSKNNFQPLN